MTNQLTQEEKINQLTISVLNLQNELVALRADFQKAQQELLQRIQEVIGWHVHTSDGRIMFRLPQELAEHRQRQQEQEIIRKHEAQKQTQQAPPPSAE